MATPLLLMSTKETSNHRNLSLQEDIPGPNPPKSRGRKPGKSAQAKNKVAQRGMGVAQLERIINQQHPHNSQQQQPQQQQQLIHHPFQQYHVQQLTGVPLTLPVTHYGFPVHPAHRAHTDTRSAYRAMGGSEGLQIEELPSMPNLQDQDGYNFHHSIKKKRVIDDDVGFMRSRKSDDKYAVDDQINLAPNASNFSGFDLKIGENNHYFANMGGSFSGYAIAGSEVVAIHRKGNEPSKVTMEYGFFPGKSQPNYDEQDRRTNFNNEGSHNSSSITTYDSYKMEELNLRIGCSVSSSPSPSPCSSLSSLSSSAAITTAAPSSAYLDLSLKL